jgi:hypothetical protein
VVQDKSLMARSYRLTEQGERLRSTAFPFTAFANLGELYDEGSAQPIRHRALAISWEATDELVLEINVNLSQHAEPSPAKGNSATERAASLTTVALSHPRPAVPGNQPCD